MEIQAQCLVELVEKTKFRGRIVLADNCFDFESVINDTSSSEKPVNGRRLLPQANTQVPQPYYLSSLQDWFEIELCRLGQSMTLGAEEYFFFYRLLCPAVSQTLVSRLDYLEVRRTIHLYPSIISRLKTDPFGCQF